MESPNYDDLDEIPTLSSMSSALIEIRERVEQGEFCEIVITDEITAQHIYESLSLPFEIGLTESNERIILTPLVDKINKIPESRSYFNRMKSGRFCFHSHNFRKDGIIANTPSGTDIVVVDFIDKGKPQLLAHGNGIIQFQSAQWNPLTNSPYQGDTRDLRDAWFKAQGYNPYSTDREDVKGMPKVIDLQFSERIRLTRLFCEQTGMIVREALWNEQNEVEEMLKIINLKVQS